MRVILTQLTYNSKYILSVSAEGSDLPPTERVLYTPTCVRVDATYMTCLPSPPPARPRPEVKPSPAEVRPSPAEVKPSPAEVQTTTQKTTTTTSTTTPEPSTRPTSTRWTETNDKDPLGQTSQGKNIIKLWL